MTCSATAERITRALDGDWHGHYGTAPAPGHSKRDRSLSIRPHPADPEDVILHSFAGEDWQEVKTDLRRQGLLSGNWKSFHRQDLDEQQRRRKIEAARRATDTTAERLRIALWLWDNAIPADRTIVPKYLQSRKIEIDAFPTTIRFSPARPPKHPHPAMIAAFGLPDEPEPGLLRIPRDRIQGIHLTLLKPDGGNKAETEPNKIMIGRSAGWPIVIAPPNDGLALAIGEGIETTASYCQENGMGGWAAGSAGRLPGLADKVPDYIEVVTILTEPELAARRGADELAERLIPRGIEVREAVDARRE
jgi:hypothetical protein